MKNSLTTLIDDDLYARFTILQKFVRDDKGSILSNSAFLSHLMSIGIDYYEKNVLTEDRGLMRYYKSAVDNLIHLYKSC